MESRIKEIKGQFLKGNIVNADIRYLLDSLQQATDREKGLRGTINSMRSDYTDLRSEIEQSQHRERVLREALEAIIYFYDTLGEITSPGLDHMHWIAKEALEASKMMDLDFMADELVKIMISRGLSVEDMKLVAKGVIDIVDLLEDE
jgi:hypothetical protein